MTCEGYEVRDISGQGPLGICKIYGASMGAMDMEECPRLLEMFEDAGGIAHIRETKAGLDAILSAITSLNRGDRCTTSLEVGPVGSRMKFYFDPRDPVEAEGLMRNALSIRARTLQELAKQEAKP